MMAQSRDYQDVWDRPLAVGDPHNIDPRLLGHQDGPQQGMSLQMGFQFTNTNDQQQPQSPISSWDSPQHEGLHTNHMFTGELLQSNEGYMDILGNATTGFARQSEYMTPEAEYTQVDTPKPETMFCGAGERRMYTTSPVGPVDQTELHPVQQGTQTPRFYPTTLVPSGPEAVWEEGTAPGQRSVTANTTDAAKPRRRQQESLYAIDVVPASLEDPNVCAHQVEVHERLVRKDLGGYQLRWTSSVHFGNQLVRRFVLPQRAQQDDRTRLLFMQVFNSNRSYNSKLPGYEFKMVQVFEPQQFHPPSDEYDIAGLAGDVGDGLARFGDHGIADLAAYTPPSPEPHHELDLPPLAAMPEQPVTLPTPKDDNDIHAGQRSKPIPKPDRDVRKNANGKYECNHEGCTEEQREFNRKCEWNKHMDKHERPYKCLAEGCEKLAGFTYSGGLLRHEREVHSKHGGPRNPLNCPHVNCKRHNGKGFSRLENLNEHLRRVHTNPIPGASGDEAAEDGDSVAASETGQVLQSQLQFQPQPEQLQLIPQPQQLQHSPQLVAIVPQKRPHEDDGTDLPSEVKRLRQSEDDLLRANQELMRELVAQRQQAEIEAANQKQELEAQKRQIMAMMAEMETLQRQIDEQHVHDPAILEFP